MTMSDAGSASTTEGQRVVEHFPQLHRGPKLLTWKVNIWPPIRFITFFKAGKPKYTRISNGTGN